MLVIFLLLPLFGVCTNITTVHIVVHSHDDLGWLVTEDSYYYGCNSFKTHSVDTIISNIVSSLVMNPTRRSIYAEVGFLKMWWDDQHENARQLLKELVQSGRLEIVNGGWSMPDEACPHYNEMMNDFITGHEFLTKELGILPRTAYQIDPFGHSAEYANLVIQLGYTNLIINRIHHKDRENRRRAKEMEFFWSPYNNTSRIFTHILYNHYGSPDRLAFDDTLFNDMTQPFVDREDSPCYTATYFQDILLERVNTWKNSYKTSHVMMLFGNDFTLSLGHRVFNNLDRLIKHFDKNSHLGVKVRYSTISEYLAEVRRENKVWNLKTGDFFPYADNEHSYWSGYYSSRSWLKENIVKTGRFVRNLDRMLAINYLDRKAGTRGQVEHSIEKIRSLREYLGIVMHHDAVSGTASNEVSLTYNNRLRQRKTELDGLVSELISHNSEIQFISCDALFNETRCELLENYSSSSNSTIDLAISNPSTYSQERIIQLPFPYKNIILTDIYHSPINFNLILNDSFLSSTLKYKILFRAVLPPMSITHYLISLSSQNSTELVYSDSTTGELHNERYSLNYTQNLFTLQDFSTNNKFDFRICPEYYTPIQSFRDTSQRSGHYIFLPESDLTTALSPCTDYRLLTTDYLSRLQFRCGNLVDVSLSLYKLSENVYPEIEYYIDGIKATHKQMEIIARYRTDVYHFNEFYTDSNSLGYLKRQWNLYDGAEFDIKEEIAFNYYPVNGYLAVKSNETDLWVGVIPDRSQGGTALGSNGNIEAYGTELELMIYRQTNGYDNRGIPEPYLETLDGYRSVSVVTKHILVAEESLDRVRLASFRREDEHQVYLANLSNANLLNTEYSSNGSITCSDLENYIVHLRLKTPEIFILRVQQLLHEGSFPIRCYLESILPKNRLYTLIELNLDETESYYSMTSRTRAWEHLIQTAEQITIIPGDISLGIGWDHQYILNEVSFGDFPIKTFAFKLK